MSRNFFNTTYLRACVLALSGRRIKLEQNQVVGQHRVLACWFPLPAETHLFVQFAPAKHNDFPDVTMQRFNESPDDSHLSLFVMCEIERKNEPGSGSCADSWYFVFGLRA